MSFLTRRFTSIADADAASRPRTRTPRVLAAASGAALVAAMATAAGPAYGSTNPQADATAGSASTDRQEVVDSVAERLVEAPGSAGYAGLAVDPSALHIDLWWKGPVPPTVGAIVSSPGNGVTVTVHAATYSRSQLLHAADRMFEQPPSVVGGEVSLVLPRVNGSGLDVEVAPGKGLVKGGLAKGQVRRFAPEGLGLGVPVAVSVGAPMEQVTRQNDSDPWFGGGAMRQTDGSFCSTGFAVVRPDGFGRLLSASHCDASGNEAWRDGALESLSVGGSAVSVIASRDSMLIDPVGGTGGKVHGGPWNATSTHSRYHLRVAGHAANFIGDRVCSSGANSGEHCDLRISNDVAKWPCNGYTCSGSLAVSPTSIAAAIAGDSGGPVYAKRSDGRVTARGIISAVDTPTSCGSYRFFPGYFEGTTIPVCGKRVYYYPIRPLLTAWGVALETS